MNKKITLTAPLAILTSLIVLSTQIPSISASLTTFVKVCPQSLTLGPDKVVGKDILVGVCVENVADLYGFDIRLSWNTEYFAYLNHTVTVPWNDTRFQNPIPPCNYPGLLYAPVLEVKDEVNATAGTYILAYACRAPAPVFNGSGTAFIMWFRIIKQPYEYEGVVTFNLTLYTTKLSNKTGKPIAHQKVHGSVTIHPLIDRKVHTVIIDSETYKVLTVSNGTVSDIDYSRLLIDKSIKFNVTGPTSKAGYVNITIPKTLMWANPGEYWEIYVDDQPLPSGQIQISENATHTSLYFTFTYPSEVSVKIISPNVIPEISSAVLIIPLIVTTVTATITKKKKENLIHPSFFLTSVPFY